MAVRELTERSLKLMEASLLEWGIATRVSHQDPDLEIKADPNLMEQVMINLIKNGIEALGQAENRSIEIVSGGDKNSRYISITDNGCGIAEAELEEIFVPFYSSKDEGSGIGLSLSKQIMLMHGGNIVVRSEPGKGSTFKLLFLS